MGCDATAFLYRGVVFPEGYEFPWDAEPYGGSIEDWWIREICQWDLPRDAESYWGHYLQFKKDNPLPVEETFAGTDGCLYQILASWMVSAEWDGEEVEIPDLDPEADARLLAFLEKYCQPISEWDEAPDFTPKLRLSARWW